MNVWNVLGLICVLMMEKTATFDDRNTDPGLGQSQKYGGVDTINGIPAFSLLIVGYPTLMFRRIAKISLKNCGIKFEI
jgi:hypothetical protein